MGDPGWRGESGHSSWPARIPQITYDRVEIIAINRATGYMGSVQTVMQAAGTGDGLGRDLSWAIDEIKLLPPNLKIWVERDYKIQEGLKKGELVKDQIIGYEGAALSSDIGIAIHTEWLKPDGTPFPVSPDTSGADFGYTGRLAYLSGNEQVASNEAVGIAHFPIKPGRQLQVFQLPGSHLPNQHFYVQVSGEPYTGHPIFGSNYSGSLNKSADFSSTGVLQGKLEHRPDKFVPFKVQVFDEKNTELQRQVYRKLKAENPGQTYDTPKPVYQWVYRPEFQYSLYGLKVQELNRYEDKQDTSSKTNILNATQPVIASSDDLVELLYKLDITNYQPLDYFNIQDDKELIFALGEQEVKAKINQNDKIEFENLDHLAKLDPEDYLTLRLYTNNDVGNVLWEYAFELLYVESTTIGYENQTDDVWYITADDPKVELKSGVVGYAYRDPATKSPIKIRWKGNGLGFYNHPLQTSSDTGLFDVTLTMPTVKGATADVRVELVDTGTEATWKKVEVLAGKPHHLTVTSSGQAIAMSQGDVTLDVLVYDAYNNLVEDGTEVQFQFGDHFLVKEQTLSTTDGKASIVLTGGEYAIAESIVSIQSGTATGSQTLSIQGLDVQLVAETSTLDVQETTTVTATVTTQAGTPVADVPVSFSAAKGLFEKQEVLTDGNGVAQTKFTGGLNEFDDTWVAQAGYVGIAKLDYSVKNSSASHVDAKDTMLVADEVAAGSISYDIYDLTNTLAYETQATLEVRSDSASTVKIGDMADPNLEPIVSLSMNQLVTVNGQVSVQDAHEINPGKADDINIVYDHPLGAGRSAHFTSSSKVTLAENPLFDIGDNRGFRLDIKPYGEGDIVNYDSNALNLSYSGGQFRLSLKTTDGTVNVLSPSMPLYQWHRVAAKVQGQTLSLYVNGQIYIETFTGSVEIPVDPNAPIQACTNCDGVEIGGLEARIRGFRVYDYASLPLVTFDDGSTEKAVNAGTQTLTIKSLGNLGKQVSGSQLNSLRVAIAVNNQRNYASLLTKRGYQHIAQQYLQTVSPQSPYAFHTIKNPFISFVPTAYAWTWEGVWDGVKEGVGFLIPYEDFIIIGEQLVYLMNEDWENFDATALAFASLGAATIIPIAKPLKPILAPIKKVVDGMRRFPASKHFAGAVGTAVKAGLSGKTEKIANLLPFILIAIELYNDPEVFEFVMNAIESEEDLWVWIEYVAEVVKVEGGLDELASYNPEHFNQAKQIAANPLSFLIANAHAKPKKAVGDILIARIKSVTKSIDVKDAKQVSQALREIFKDPQLKTLAASGTSTLRVFAAVGGAKIAKFIQNSKDWRVNRWLVLFSMIYLVEEADAKRLNISNDSQFTSLISNLFSPNKSNFNGAVFQIVQTAYFHARHQAAKDTMPKVIGIDVVRAANFLKNGLVSGNAYKRQVDIVLEYPDETEEWVELKSYSNKTISGSVKPKDKVFAGANIFREFFHDYRLNDEFITDKPAYRTEILNAGTDPTKTNKIFTWYFQDFNTPKGLNNPGEAPKITQIETVRKKLCNKPTDVRVEDYQYNFKNTRLTVEKKCLAEAKKQVELRNTRSYFTEVLDVIGSDFALTIQKELLGVD